VLVAVPVEDGSESFVVVVAVTILGHGFTIPDVSTIVIQQELSGSGVFSVTRSGCRLVGVVLVFRSGDKTGLKSKSKSGAGADTVIVEDIEIGEETSGSLDDTNLEVSE